MSTPIEIVSTPSDFVLSKSAHYRIRPSRHGTRNRKFETIRTDSSKSQKSSGENRRRKYGHCNQMERDVLNKKLYLSHPYLENVSEALTIEYMNGLGQALGLRRAFSDINLSSSWSEFKEEFCKKNHNCMTDNKIDETAVSVTDKDFFSLIFAKGYVT